MAVSLLTTVKQYVGKSTDSKPRVGIPSADGVTPTASEIAPGSTFLEIDTGKLYRWNGSDWAVPNIEETLPLLMSEMLVEIMAIRSGLELFLAIERGVNVDLRTEQVSQLEIK